MEDPIGGFMTHYPWLDAYCLSLTGAKKDFKVEWGATRYLLGDKMFAMVGGDKEGRAIVSLKLKPENGLMLREAYPDITPGYYLNKTHWNSIYLEGAVPDDLLKQMIQESHELVFNGLSKKVKEMLNAK